MGLINVNPIHCFRTERGSRFNEIHKAGTTPRVGRLAPLSQPDLFIRRVEKYKDETGSLKVHNPLTTYS